MRFSRVGVARTSGQVCKSMPKNSSCWVGVVTPSVFDALNVMPRELESCSIRLCVCWMRANEGAIIRISSM